MSISESPSSSSHNASTYIPVHFPPCFSGDGTADFAQWCQRFEVALDACSTSATIDMAKTLGSHLTGSAFTVWYSFAPEIRSDYKKAKGELAKIFSKRDEITSFQRMLNARPRQPGEPLQVYKSELSRLTTLAFPLLNEQARADEIFRRFVAGLDPDMQSKCHEFGVKSISDAMDIAERMERAAESRRLASPFSVCMPHVAVAADNGPTHLEQILQKLDSLQINVQSLQSKYDSLRAASHRPSRDSPPRSRDRYRSPSPYGRDNYSASNSYDRRHRPTTPNRQPYSDRFRGRSPSPYPSRSRDRYRNDERRSFSATSRSPSRREYSASRDHDERRDNDRYRYRSQSPSNRSSSSMPRQNSPARVSFQENQD